VQVSEFLIREPFNRLDAYKRSHAFLISLFKATYCVLVEIAHNVANVSPEERRRILSNGFRDYMRADQTFEKHGKQRTQFYDEVIRQANVVSRAHHAP